MNNTHFIGMFDKQVRVLAALPLLLLASTPALGQGDRGWSHNDAVLHWNAIALQAVADDHSGTWRTTGDGRPAPERGGPTASSRALAIVHLAIYDAVNAIDKSHDPYLPVVLRRQLLAGASVHSAVAQAARDTLVALYPSQKKVLDRELRRYLDRLPPGRDRQAGKRVGATAADNILEVRAHDGADVAVPYQPGTAPGEHQADPLNPDQGFLGPGWGLVDTFSGIDVTDPYFRAPRPPPLNSSEYAAAFAEVARLGGDGLVTSTLRSPEQTEIAIFWAYDGTIGLGTPPRLYNQAARQIAKLRKNTLIQNARLFALVNMAMADTGIAAWESKYFYNLWRPVVAIRRAGSDGNPATRRIRDWTPLGAPASNQSGRDFTPPFPAYPSGHAAFGSAAFRMLDRFYGTDEFRFRLGSDELNGKSTDWAGNTRPKVVRRFERFSDAARENAQSRIYLGIHWQFDATAGIDQGAAIADYVFDTLLLPMPE